MRLNVRYCCDFNSTDGLVITHSGLLSELNLIFKYFQLWQQNGRLQRIQAAVHAYANMVITPVLSMTSYLSQHNSQFIVVRKNSSPVPITAQGFAWEEACTGNRGQVAGTLPFIGCAEALGSIFYYRYAVLGSDSVDRVKIGALPV